jgi:hypothetical protein
MDSSSSGAAAAFRSAMAAFLDHHGQRRSSECSVSGHVAQDPYLGCLPILLTHHSAKER